MTIEELAREVAGIVYDETGPNPDNVPRTPYEFCFEDLRVELGREPNKTERGIFQRAFEAKIEEFCGPPNNYVSLQYW